MPLVTRKKSMPKLKKRRRKSSKTPFSSVNPLTQYFKDRNKNQWIGQRKTFIKLQKKYFTDIKIAQAFNVNRYVVFKIRQYLELPYYHPDNNIPYLTKEKP